MKCNVRIVGAVLASLGAVFLASQIQCFSTQRRKHVTKKLVKEAVQSWEGEGGKVVEGEPETAAA